MLLLLRYKLITSFITAYPVNKIDICGLKIIAAIALHWRPILFLILKKGIDQIKIPAKPSWERVYINYKKNIYKII